MPISKKLKILDRFYLVLLVCFFYKLIFIANAVELKGNFIQGGIIFGKTNLGSTVFYNNLKVPKILLSGNKEKINEWRDKKSDEKTKKMKF